VIAVLARGAFGGISGGRAYPATSPIVVRHECS
jgi:hypothetical protein